LTAAWLAEGIGITMSELGHDDLPQDQHPLRDRRSMASYRPGQAARHWDRTRAVSKACLAVWRISNQRLGILSGTPLLRAASVLARR